LNQKFQRGLNTKDIEEAACLDWPVKIDYIFLAAVSIRSTTTWKLAVKVCKWKIKRESKQTEVLFSQEFAKGCSIKLDKGMCYA
jgi:hypothetical protein